ncbi:hypothetical protein MOKP126_19370 [Mycobacterium avium subsp. hominissuis]
MTTGQGESTASTGAKKKPVPMYQADPARSEASTNRSQRGTSGLPDSAVRLRSQGAGLMAVPIIRWAGRTLPR